MTGPLSDEQFVDETLRQFSMLVESVGVKRFAAEIGVGTRQVNRILAGTQTNPVERLIRSLQAATTTSGDQVLDYICQEMGGHFVRSESTDDALVNAVRECAEAIAAISDGQVSDRDIREVREAISALSSLVMSLRQARDSGPPS